MLSAPAIALTFGLASCGPSAPPSAPTAGTSPATTTANQPASGAKVTLTGAGASAPDPLYKRWLADYAKVDPNAQISYQSVGSGAGVKQFLAKTVDFGATDDPLKEDDRKKYPTDRGSAPIQVPSTGLFVVLAYNLQGVDGLKLSRENYCGILDGSINTWNDPKLAKDNPGAKLPSTPITVVSRSDGSGTTAIVTSHLAKACPNWQAGSGKSIQWPVGTGAKGNEGVTAQIQQTPGAIGYTEYSFATANKLSSATLQNKSGAFIPPTPDAAAKALIGAKVNDDLSVSVPDPEGKDAYPIVSLTYLLMYEQYKEPAKAEALKKFLTWALKDGKTATAELGYIPLPDEIVTKVATQLGTIKVAAENSPAQSASK
ncbi:MAG TPA: phosphate ABC transporter substrate-binding protein PstS [Thermosynechococcaceae cyanobacterium]